ncbi:MAG: hypothetical protein R6W78_03730 [Bacteroidales bacterium]
MQSRKSCLHCGKKLAGRSDKKFCSGTCRSKYCYSVNAEFNAHKSRVHEIQLKNRNILAELNPTGKCIVDKQTLEEKNYNFNFLTSVYRTNGGNVYWFCYDYGFRQLLRSNKYQLVKWQPYMVRATAMFVK